ncbi:ion transporter [Chloroflexota bacterium]
MNQKGMEELQRTLPGDKVLRIRRRKSRGRLRQLPRAPEIVNFFRVLVLRTPFLPMMVAFVVLMLVFAAIMYAVEHNAPGAAMNTYGESLWWALATAETMGTPYKPVTGAGHIVGGIWAILGVILLFGTIIASITSYITRPRPGPAGKTVATIQHNFASLDQLTLDELRALKQVTDQLVDAQIQKVTAGKKSEP